MGEWVSWVTVALTLGAETGTVNSWASAVPTRGVGTGAGEDQSTAALGARTGNSRALATLTWGTGTGAGGGWTAAALGTGPGAQGELLAVLKSASCFPHTDWWMLLEVFGWNAHGIGFEQITQWTVLELGVWIGSCLWNAVQISLPRDTVLPPTGAELQAWPSPQQKNQTQPCNWVVGKHNLKSISVPY